MAQHLRCPVTHDVPQDTAKDTRGYAGHDNHRRFITQPQCHVTADHRKGHQADGIEHQKQLMQMAHEPCQHNREQATADSQVDVAGVLGPGNRKVTQQDIPHGTATEGGHEGNHCEPEKVHVPAAGRQSSRHRLGRDGNQIDSGQHTLLLRGGGYYISVFQPLHRLYNLVGHAVDMAPGSLLSSVTLTVAERTDDLLMLRGGVVKMRLKTTALHTKEVRKLEISHLLPRYQKRTRHIMHLLLEAFVELAVVLIGVAVIGIDPADLFVDLHQPPQFLRGAPLRGQSRDQSFVSGEQQVKVTHFAAAGPGHGTAHLCPDLYKPALLQIAERRHDRLAAYPGFF